MKIKIAPSILSADFGNINKDIRQIEDSSDLIHVDVMDGHFVPNITIGPVVVKGLRSKKPLDVHLMINEPDKYVEAFAKAGAASITFHAQLMESKDAKKLIAKIKNLGCKAAVALNPDKKLDLIKDYVKEVDMVLMMTVFPGFGGQKFIEKVLPKIKKLREQNPELDIQVDGGINSETIKKAAEAGANVFVAGNAVFSKENRVKVIKDLRNNAELAWQK
jgi:ribulose-phosphate 3-epimerase